MHTRMLLSILGAMGAQAHMFMSDPPPLRAANNPNAGGDVDYELKSPIELAQFPCRGDLGLVGTEAGAPVADYKAGQSYSATIEGGAAHNGGSCQFSLSYDKGKTFKVIQSIIGDCPVSGGSSFDFTIPADAPSSDSAIFSWSWNNKVGNREFYQNCAVVSISGGSGGGSGGGKTRRQGSASFNDLPDMFVANIIDGCSVAEGTDVLYPDPGPNVVKNTEGTPPEGSNCGAAAVGGGGDSSDGGDGGDTGAGGGQGGGDAGTGGGQGGGDAGTGGGQGGGDDGQYHPPGESSASGSSPTAPGAPAESGPAQTKSAGTATSASGPASGGETPAPSSGSDAPQPSVLVPSPTPAFLSILPVPESSHASSTGGVFVTAPADESAAPSGSAPADNDTPTTLATSAAAPSATGSPSGGNPSGGSSGGDSAGGAGEKTGKCADGEDGKFNCVGGNQFQRCASGVWSPVRPMAEGTSCAPGLSDDLFARKRLRFRRH